MCELVCLCVVFVVVIVCMLVFKMLILNLSNPISRSFVQKAILTMDEVNCNFCFFFLAQCLKCLYWIWKKTSLKRLESEPARKKYEALESYTEAVQSSIERPTCFKSTSSLGNLAKDSYLMNFLPETWLRTFRWLLRFRYQNTRQNKCFFHTSIPLRLENITHKNNSLKICF